MIKHALKKEVNFENVDSTFINQGRPKDLYDNINRKNQKIDINPNVEYKSTSQDEVFEPRIFEMRAEAITGIN